MPPSLTSPFPYMIRCFKFLHLFNLNPPCSVWNLSRIISVGSLSNLKQFWIELVMAAVQAEQRLWDGVLELTKAAQEKGTDPLMWAMQLSSNLTAAGISMPSTEVAELLVSYICWSNNIPIAWKFLEKALTIRIVPPMFVVALLSTRSMLISPNLLIILQTLVYDIQASIWKIYGCVKNIKSDFNEMCEY